MNNIEYPILILDSIDGSKFIYSNKEVNESFHPIEWLEKECISNGSSLEGRKTAFRKLTNTSQKPGILINEYNGLLYFPLKADTNHNNIYVNYFELVDFKQKSAIETELYFCTGLQYTVPFAYRTIKNQIHNCVAFFNALHKIN